MPQRPDPDALLRKVQETETRDNRARFKVFFGAAPGVGKTYAMLQEGQRRKWEGMDVVVGLAETHKRPETQALLAGLEVLPRKSLTYRGVLLEEFDLEGALARRPVLILVDELAHTNAPGCKHAKRWQDVLELLDAGIDVYSTINVQHLESLKEVVGQITGILVQERIPDTVLERTDELELVDISVEELTERLAEGKVYVPEQARHAIQRFFRKGNLLALRELALRRTAELVNADMERYREVQGIQETWAARERLLVCITPRTGSESLIRETRRMADSLGAPWIAVHVDDGRALKEAEREQLESHLRLVERLGGEGIVLPGHGSLASDLLILARNRNVTQILLGQPDGPRWLERLRGTLLDELVAASDQIHVHVIPTRDAGTRSLLPKGSPSAWPDLRTLGLCGLNVAIVTAFSWMVFPWLELADIVMLFTIPILVAGTRYGRKAALITSFLVVLCFDFFFIQPRYTLAVGDARHWGTFGILLLLGFVIGDLTERVRQMALRAQSREQRTLALFRLGEALVRAGDQTETISSAAQAVQAQFQARVCFLLPGPEGRLAPIDKDGEAFWSEGELAIAHWAFEHAQPAGLGTETLPGSQRLYLPLHSQKGVIGVMGLQTESERLWAEPDNRHLLESFANQTALALERAILASETQAVRLRIEKEEVRNTLLSSISHDLRTPLSSILGSATALIEDPHVLPEEERQGLLLAIRDEAFRLHRLVSNLLNLTRLESGELQLHGEWLPAEELVGCALAHLARVAESREIRVQVEPPGTFLYGDPLLLEQLLVNLLDNALKFSRDVVDVKVHDTGNGAVLLVIDRGPGIPEGEEAKIFQKLYRLASSGAPSGAGLGLAICKSIVEAHGGRILAGNHSQGGAQFFVSLPYHGEPPTAPQEEIPRDE